MTPFDFLLARMALAARFHFRETSGFRASGSNRALKGAYHSAHQHFLGVDVVLERGQSKADFREAAERLGCWVLDERDHLHLQPASWRRS